MGKFCLISPRITLKFFFICTTTLKPEVKLCRIFIGFSEFYDDDIQFYLNGGIFLFKCNFMQ